MKEWLIESQKYPKEIVEFINSTFDLFEIRGQINNENGISFVIHSNESNHSIPHLHAKYGEFEISIAIDDAKVICGNLPKSKEKYAVNWVKYNREKLLNEWNEITISAISSTTCSKLCIIP